MGHIESFFELSVGTAADANQFTVCIEQATAGTSAHRVCCAHEIGRTIVPIDVNDLRFKSSRVAAGIASEADKRLSFCDFRSQLCKADRWHDFRCLYFQECKIDVFIPANQSGSVRDRFAVFKDFDFNYGIV